MHTAPQNEFEGADQILRRYYKHLVKEIAEDIIQHREDFEGGGFTGVDELIEKHSDRLCRLNQVHWHVHRFAQPKKPVGTEPLAKNEFRCFGCGGVIRAEEERCRLCGWTWR